LLVAFAWICCMLLQPALGAAFGGHGIGVSIFFSLIGVIYAGLRPLLAQESHYPGRPSHYSATHLRAGPCRPGCVRPGRPALAARSTSKMRILVRRHRSCNRHAPDHWANGLHLKQNGPVAKP
jgi:hypothetical protein